MTVVRRGRAPVLAGVAMLALAACSSSAGTSSAAGSQPSGGGAVSPHAASSRAPAGGRPGTNPAEVDVCALLSASDANQVAHAHGLDGAQTDATHYTLTATRQAGTGAAPSSSCKFTIASSGAEGTVVFVVTAAKDFSLYASGTKVDGLGDEAYDDGSATVVRVGTLMLAAGEDSFTHEFTTDLLRRMAPHLK
jgi:hypothetical protein